MSEIKNRIEHSNLGTFVNCAISMNNEVMESTIREAIRIIDDTNNKLNFVIAKCPQHCEMIDLEAKKSFPNDLSASAMKCMAGFNMNGTRCCLMNENKEDASCPRHSKTEDWDHLMQCECLNEMKEERLNRLNIY